MPNRGKVAVSALGAVAVVVGVLFVYERGDVKALPQSFGFPGDPATAKCQGSIVELDFDPKGRIEARTSGQTIASADVGSRELRYDACTKVRTPSGYSERGVRYTTIHKRTTLTCRFPGRFFVNADSVSTSWSGDWPAGNSVSLVLASAVRPGPGPKRTILASAVVLERSNESYVVFVRRYCVAA